MEWKIGDLKFKGKLKITASFSLDKAKALTKILEIGGEKLVQSLITGAAESAASSAAVPLTAISAVEIAAIAAPIAWIAACSYAFYKLHKYDKDLWDLRTAPGKAADAYAAGFKAGLTGGSDTSNEITSLGSKAGAKMRETYLDAYLKNPVVVKWLKENNDDKKTVLAEFEKKFSLMIPKLVRAAWSAAMADAKNKKFQEFLDEHGNEGTTLAAWGEFLVEYPDVARWGDTGYVSAAVWAFIAGKYAGREFTYKNNTYQLPSKQAEMYPLLKIDAEAQKADLEDLFKIEKAFAAFLKGLKPSGNEDIVKVLYSWTLPGKSAEVRAFFNQETHHKATEKDLSDASIGTMIFAEITRREQAKVNDEAEKKRKQEEKIANLKKADKANITQVDYGNRTKGIHAKAQGMQEKLGKKIQENSIPRVVVAARSLHNKGNEVFGQAYTKWQQSMKEPDLEKRVNMQTEAIELYQESIIHYETGLDCYTNPPAAK